MCDAIFTFGQRGNHFVQSPSKRDHTRLPKKLHQLITPEKLAHIYHVTLGHQDSFLITYRDQEGVNWIACQNLPPELTTFLYATTPSNNTYLRSIPNIRLTLGPYNTSFFVGDGSSYLWMNLPPLLLNALQSRIQNGTWLDKPRIVSLGADGNFVLVTENHAAVWDLSEYRTLAHMLKYSRTQARGIAEIKDLVLHGYRYQGFVAQSMNGTLLYENLPEWSMAGLKGMAEAVLRDTREAEAKKREGESRSRPTTIAREWSSRKKEVDRKVGEFEKKARAKGLSLSLSLSSSLNIGPAGISFGKKAG